MTTSPESKWTKGPWSVDGDGVSALVRGGDATIVAIRHRLTAQTHEANAHLISSAPDLYEALKAAVDCGMVPISSASEGGAARHSRQVEVADMIRAAIAKAEGR